MSADEPAPGTTAVIRVPPIEPEFGEMETSFGVKVKGASTTECPSGIPTSKQSFCVLNVWEVTFTIVKSACVVVTEADV